MNAASAIQHFFGRLFRDADAAGGAAYVPTPVKAMEAITGAESFGALLPYCAYHQGEGLFVLDSGERDSKAKSGALGMAIEITPQTGATEDMIRVLGPIFGNAPPGTHIQVSLYGGTRIIDQLKLSALMRQSGDTSTEEQRGDCIYRVLARRRSAHYLAGTRKRLVPHLPFLLRDLRVVLTIARPCNPRDLKIMEELVRMREGVHATLNAANFHCWNWGPTELINWCDELLNPDAWHRRPPHFGKCYDPGRLLRRQIVDPNTLCRPSDDGKTLRYGQPRARDEMHSRLYGVSSYPKDFRLWSMGNLIGDLYRTQLGYPCPYLVTMGVRILDQAGNKDLAQMKGARATTNASSPMARFLPEYQDRKRDWDIVNASYAAGMGEVDMYHQVLLMAPPDDIEAAETAARSIWKARGFDLVNLQYMQVPAILGSLPLGFTEALHRFYERKGLCSRKTTMNAVNLAPMIGEWKGTQTPVLNLVGRRGQLMGLDLFDNKGGNYNAACAASSGSGKSLLANEITTAYLGVGAKVMIIDVGRSYEKICRQYEGEFIEFVRRESGGICINPFDNIVDLDEDMEMIKPMVAQMASPSGTLSDHDNALLEISIVAAWQKRGNAMTPTDIAADLKANFDPAAQRLGDQLFPYTEDGMYGKYFQGRCNVDFSNDFVVLELEELNAKKDLQSVVLFIMMFRITQAMYHDRRDRKKICIIDESWDLMNGANSGRFIEVGYRRARKYGGAFITLTQSLADYYKNPAAQAALENSDWLFLLKQKKDTVEQLDRQGKLRLDDTAKRFLDSLKTEQGWYSEIYISSPMGSGVGRLLVDPFSLLAYSSDPQDWKAIQHYRDQGYEVTDAINAVLADRKRHAEANP